MQFSLTPMTADAARTILYWRYPEPYALYNLKAENEAEELGYFLEPHYDYHALHDETGQLVGFCCFGQEGQVPGGDYSEAALDIGLGMRPDLTGQGLGDAFLAAILAFADQEFAPKCLRATIAKFNGRSMRVFAKAGFQPIQTFLSRSEPPREFVVMVKEVDSRR
ncbi:MAG: GNAT family protein [Caldilineaceae bacterium]